MIEKLLATVFGNIWVTIAYVLVIWALVDTYHLSEWGWFAFFMFSLPFYIYKLAEISTAYDMMKRNGKI